MTQVFLNNEKKDIKLLIPERNILKKTATKRTNFCPLVRKCGTTTMTLQNINDETQNVSQ